MKKVKKTKFEFCLQSPPHCTVVSKTTLAYTAAYNANTHPESYTGKIKPASNKTSYCNINVGKQQQNEQTFFHLGCG